MVGVIWVKTLWQINCICHWISDRAGVKYLVFIFFWLHHSVKSPPPLTLPPTSMDYWGRHHGIHLASEIGFPQAIQLLLYNNTINSCVCLWLSQKGCFNVLFASWKINSFLMPIHLTDVSILNKLANNAVLSFGCGSTWRNMSAV